LSYSAAGFVRVAAHRLDPDVAADVARLIDSTSLADWLLPRLDGLLQTLEYRQAMHRELADQ
jgi:hypothetical protein